MRFKNRDEAAKQFAGRLAAYKGQKPLILGEGRYFDVADEEFVRAPKLSRPTRRGRV